MNESNLKETLLKLISKDQVVIYLFGQNYPTPKEFLKEVVEEDFDELGLECLSKDYLETNMFYEFLDCVDPEE